MTEVVTKLGRGYMLAYVGVALTAVLSIIVLFKDPSKVEYILGYWQEFLTWFVIPIVTAKELGKFGQSVFGKKKP